uniref:AlNc14C249G9601 protein n=1 Tax=Albugo laibachii Nc14 TaxID=890382 RepID=F0WTC1_9STRA|nr:AlNc14C249G9601 [Albugo laibachii Nc14]|eukprot:CCA24611.1 AlNc14C249G9601 [Albugo laibachii Nc14]
MQPSRPPPNIAPARPSMHHSILLAIPWVHDSRYSSSFVISDSACTLCWSSSYDLMTQ